LDAPAPIIIKSVEQLVIIDRLIADRAYQNIKAGLPADRGIDFALLDEEMEKYAPELNKFDPVYYSVLRETYERMKAYVTNPKSDFVRAIQKPGSVEFEGRSPLPAAAFDDSARQGPNAEPADWEVNAMKLRPGWSIQELEPHLPSEAQRTLLAIRKMPEDVASAREAKLQALEREIAAWKKNGDQLAAAVMIAILQGMLEQIQPAAVLPRIDADILPAGITPEMLSNTYKPRGTAMPGRTAAESSKKVER